MYWLIIFVHFRTEVCCGIIFKGLNGEVLVDPQLLHPCYSCTKGSKSQPGKLRRSQSTEDAESTTSSNSYSEDMDIVSENSPPDLTIANYPCADGSALSSYNQPPPLALECWWMWNVVNESCQYTWVLYIKNVLVKVIVLHCKDVNWGPRSSHL